MFTPMSDTPVARLSGLFVYPVKSLRGCAVTSVDVDELGPIHDRRFLVVDPTGRFLTQRVLPRMALVETAVDGAVLRLGSAGFGSAEVPLHVPAGSAPLRTVSVWKSEGLQAEDCGDAPADWLSRFLGVACRLVRIGRDFHRPILKSTARPGDVVTFADAFPFMGISEASLADLNARLRASGEAPVPMDRFRPGLVFADCPAFAEDTWPRFRIGGLTFRAGGSCARCVVTTTDQATAQRYVEPLRLLATYRRDPVDASRICFGQNAIHENKAGRLSLGDPVFVATT